MYASCLCFPAQEHHRVICEALMNSLSNREMVLQGGWRRAEQRYVLQSCYVVLHVRYAEPLLWKTARGQKTKRLPVRSGRTETTSVTKKTKTVTFDLWTLTPCHQSAPRWPAPILPAPSPTPAWTPPSPSGCLESCRCREGCFTHINVLTLRSGHICSLLCESGASLKHFDPWPWSIFALMVTIIYKMSIMLYWERLKTSHRGHKPMRKMLTKDINEGNWRSFRLLYNHVFLKPVRMYIKLLDDFS